MNSNGLPETAGRLIRSANASVSATRRRLSSQSTSGHVLPCNRQPIVSLALYKAQRRRAVIAAQAAARRRTMIAVVLCTLGLIGAVVTLEREARLQQLEVRQ